MFVGIYVTGHWMRQAIHMCSIARELAKARVRGIITVLNR